MVSNTYTIAESLLMPTKERFSDNYSNVPKILIFWHNTLFLFFSSINYRKLFHTSDDEFDEMVRLGLMPAYLLKFYHEQQPFIDKYLDTAIEQYSKSTLNTNQLRQDLLNVELDFSNKELTLFYDKVSRDTMGSYYTPQELADETIRKLMQGRSYETCKGYKIIDLSCGGGDFLLAIMRYFKEQYDVEYKQTAKWVYGVDIDPIALQICITNILQYVERDKWKEIISHFSFGNPLIINDANTSAEYKNKLFATRRLYASEMGLSNSFFQNTYDIIIGNPPWEKIRFEERKFFRGVSNDISSITQKNIRNKRVEQLRQSWPVVYNWRKSVYDDYSQMTTTKYEHTLINDSIAGELNTYALFTELAYNMLSNSGCLALIVKSTLVTAPANQKLWKNFLSNKSVEGVFLFENTNKIFRIDSRERFVVFMASKEKHEAFAFATGLITPNMISTANNILLTSNDLARINPFTQTIPNVRNNDEIAFLKEAHSHLKLFSEVYPDCHFGRLIHLTAHASSISKKPSSNNIPVYEGKFIEQYDARYATFHGMDDTQKYANKASARTIKSDKNGNKDLPECRYYVSNELWSQFLKQYNEKYSLCWRSLTSPTNKRTTLAMILPTCPTCQSIQMLQTKKTDELVLLLALFNSVPFDYFVRIKMPGLDLTQSVIKQISVPSNDDYNERIVFNGIEATIKKHILSYAISLIKSEDRLSELINSFDGYVYKVAETDYQEKKKMIDLLFKKAYHLDDDSYKKMLLTFPKYQADHTA